jgi:hypothetical protein
VRARGASQAEAASCRTRAKSEPGARLGMDPTGGVRLAVRGRGREEEGGGLGRWAGKEGGRSGRLGWALQEEGKGKKKGRRKWAGLRKRDRENEKYPNAFEFEFKIKIKI